MNLADWLLEQIAADEEVARYCDLQDWTAGVEETSDGENVYAVVEAGLDTVADMSINRLAESEHIARWDPARVLAECAAKRRVVEHFQHLLDPNEPDISPEYDDGYIDATQYVVKQLAQPYRDRDGYRTEWDVQ